MADFMTPREMGQVAWHISSYSSDLGGSCVEAGPIAGTAGHIAVRHSQEPDGPTIVYTRQEWQAFLAGVRAGEFDFTD